MIRKILNFILNIIFPIECFGCGESDVLFCEGCINKFGNAKPANVDDRLLAGMNFDHSSPVVKLLEFMKYKFNQDCAKIMAQILYLRLKDELIVMREKGFILTFTPLHKKRLHWRGFNHAELICRELSKLCEISVIPCFIKIKNTKTQVGLHRAERLKNLENAFKISEEYQKTKPQKIIIFDDVYSTGSTLKECAKTLPMDTQIRLLVLFVNLTK